VEEVGQGRSGCGVRNKWVWCEVRNKWVWREDEGGVDDYRVLDHC